MKKLLLLAALCVSVPSLALAQNSPSGSPRVQGVPDGYGDPVQVTIVGSDGSGTGSTAVTQSGTWTVNAVGPAAHDAVSSGAPIKLGGKASTSIPSAVANQDAVDAYFSTTGVQATFIAAAAGSPVDVGLGSADGASAAIGLTTKGQTYVFNGSTYDRMRGDTNGIASTPGLSSTTWSYSNGATGILDNTTTAVTIKTAAGGSVRNYIDSCTINTTAFGASVPIAIRDGAAGTVLFAVNVPTTGFLQPVSVTFSQPLRGTANTLLEVVTPTANTSGTAWVNCQGHTGL